MTQIPRRPMMQLYQLASGRRILSRLDELNRTQWLSRDELLDLQQDRLYRLLVYADQFVPYYRRLFKQSDFRPGDILTDPGCFSRLPVLTKDIIRANGKDLITTDDKHHSHLSRLTTSGSTAHPLVFLQDDNFRDYVTADILRHLGWAGWDWGQPHAYIWGARFEIPISHSARARAMNWVLNRFVTNAFALSKPNMMRFVRQIRQRHPRILFGYTSSVYRFAEFVRDQRLDDVRFEGIFVSAEVLYPAQRQLIEQALGGKVFNRYGTREVGGISCECVPHTGMHISMENNYVEIVRELDSPVPTQPEETGHIVVTNLHNYGMPFIRYSVEDIGGWHQDCGCTCGRASPMMQVLQGRRVDMFTARDGRKVSPEFSGQVFAVQGIKQFQIIQKNYDLVITRIVRDGPVEQSQLDRIVRMVRSTLGEEVQVQFEFPDEIPVPESGKYHNLISEIRD